MAAVVRAFRLGSQSLWADEILTWHSVQLGLPMDLSRWLENVHGPLYGLLLHGWIALAGDSEWALRAPSLVFGVALVPTTAWFAARWLEPRAAVPAAWLAAGAPYLVWYSQEARNYSLLMLCSAAAALGLVALRERLRPTPLLVTLAASCAGVLSNFSFALLLPAQLRMALASPRERVARWIGIAVLVVALGLVAWPWASRVTTTFDFARLVPGRTLAAGETPLRGATTFHAAAIPFGLHSLAMGYSFGPPLRALRADHSLAALRPFAVEVTCAALVFGALTVLGLRAVARRGRALDALLWIGVPLLVISYFALQNFKVFHPRYLAVVMPVLVALWAAALTDLRGRARLAFAVAIVALWAVSLTRLYADPRYAKEDLRDAAQFVERERGPAEIVIAANTTDMLAYYFRDRVAVEHYWLGFARDQVTMRERFEALRSGRAAWVVMTRPEELDPSGRFAIDLAMRYPDSEQRGFEGVRVWHLPASITTTAP
ncbi:MAG: hypothetical protein HOP12_06380 [Candidatus Eisenbacteria bacterium]|uniref:Glycosyltransferase RgtA/B/C/D-like domain-containing protein n=1 Tax=Eiseniibacteriota bacterium TaxID=2212470 RepID=A0A849SJF4_UNCEI|nr:hypothetical protein [Candidatus Eisenbacteria bacterium]